MNNFELERLNESTYIDDIDTPDFDFLKKPIITKNYSLLPLGNEHFLDLFEFRLQNEPLDSDPFDKLGEKFEDAYTQFFTYLCNVDNIAWVLMDRIYVVGFFLLEICVDYNNYMERNAHLYYELSQNLKETEVNSECIKAITDNLFGNSDIPLIEMHLDNDDSDMDCRLALEHLGFQKDEEADPELGFRYYLKNTDSILDYPPRHMPFILKAYQNTRELNQESKSRN